MEQREIIGEINQDLELERDRKYIDNQEASEPVTNEEIISETQDSLEQREIIGEINQNLELERDWKYIDNQEASEPVTNEEIISEIQDSLNELSSKQPPNMPQSDKSTYERAKELIHMHNLCIFGTERGSGNIWCYNGRIYTPLMQRDLKQLVYDSLTESEKHEMKTCHPLVRQVAEYIQWELLSVLNKKKYRFEEEDFSAITSHIVFRNGVYDVMSGKLLPFSSDYPYYLEVNATFKRNGVEPPVYFKKLEAYATGSDRESMEMLDIITGAMFLQCQLKHIFVAGSASNSGKSKYIELLERLMPTGRVSRLSPSDLNCKFALGDADRVTLFSCADIEMNMITTQAASLLKRLTGDTYIRGQAKYQDASELRVNAKIILGTNGCFRPEKPDKGIANRLIVLPFVNEVSPEHRDEMLLEKMWQERDDIMTICALKLHDLMTREEKLVIPISAQSEKIKETWISCKTFLKEFLEEKMEITGNKDDNFDRKELYELYKQFYASCAGEYPEMRCCCLGLNEFLAQLFQLSKGLIERKRVSKVNGERTKNAVYRICGLRQRRPQILIDPVFPEGMIK